MSIEVKTIGVWIGPRCVLIKYTRHSENGNSSLHVIDGVPPVAVREDAEEPAGVKRRGSVVWLEVSGEHVMPPRHPKSSQLSAVVTAWKSRSHGRWFRIPLL